MKTLTDPFATVHKKDIKKNGVVVAQVDYVGWSQVADRLDAATTGWSFEIVRLGDDWCHGRLTIMPGRTFENVGYAENADADWKKEPLKDAVSDALKRCAALAGVARYLYDKDTPRSQPAQRPAAAPQTAPAATKPAQTTDEPPPWPAETLLPVAQAIFPDAELVTGDSTCPDHGFEWKHNSRGYYCSGKTNGEWCNRRPSIVWVSAQSAA